MSTRCALTTAAGGLGQFAGRARLPSTAKKLITIVTLSCCIFGVAGQLKRVVEKCCPRGQVISATEDFTCSFAGDHRRQIFQFRRQAADEVSLICPEGKNVSMARLEDVVESTFTADTACIDIMYKEDEEEDEISEPVIFRCASNGPNGDAAGTGSFAVPRLPTLRMCCGIYQVYDMERRDCVFKKGGTNVPMNFEFLKGSLEFASVVRGAPPCESTAVLDYVVDTTRDLRVHADGRLEVLLATKGGLKTIIATENNTCLDPGTSNTPGLIVIRACSEEKFCDENLCVSKCCPEDQAMIDNDCNNIPPGVPPGHFHDVLRNVSVKQALEKGINAPESSDYGMVIGRPCENPYVAEQVDSWHFTPLGNIDLANDKIYDHDEYCMELFFGNPFLKDDIYPLVCVENPE